MKLWSFTELSAINDNNSICDNGCRWGMVIMIGSVSIIESVRLDASTTMIKSVTTIELATMI